MTLEIGSVLVLTGIAVGLFATEKLPTDVVALLVMGALVLSGVLDPEQGIAGFANTATLTVGGMFVLSAGLVRTGAVRFAGRALLYLAKRSLALTVLGLMLGVAIVIGAVVGALLMVLSGCLKADEAYDAIE